MQIEKTSRDTPLVFGAPGYVCPSPASPEEVGFVRYGTSVRSVTMTKDEMLDFEGRVDALFGTGGLKKNYTERKEEAMV
jgi:hypothetical protein